MHLISLAIHGFKSFPERTLLEFHEGVTAIVGPNGSGKSNVTDAIRWVLGEQSVKTLRGDSMQDIIFSGTSSRRSMSFAEVTMNIDNSDRLLNMDYAEIAITRRLYRSGESEYLINGQQVRLKDINNLFMDTGLGKDSYSIIGQGKVDEILSTKSEDRRRVFEEAAGIQKYKTRRAEAARRLEHTEQNLTRVNDILTELEGQLEPLRKQSETAKRYLNLHAEMRREDIELLSYQIQTAAEKQTELAETIAISQADLEESRKKQEQLDLEQLATREQLALIAEKLQEQREARNRMSSQESLLLGEESRLLERQTQLERRLGEQGESAEQIEQRLSQLTAELESKREQLAKVEAEYMEAGEQFSYLRHLLHERQEHVRLIEDELTGLRQEDLRLVGDKIKLQARKMQQENEVLLLRNQEHELQAELTELTKQAEEIDNRLVDCQETLEKIKRSDTELREDSKQLGDAIAKLRLETEAAESTQEGLAQEIRNKNYRLDTLRELERNLEGYAEPVRRILRRAEGDSRLRSSVKGALGSLVQVDPRYELAIEIALGASVQNIVVDTARTAADMIELLKRERLGRATFLPIDTIRPRYLGDRELDELERLRHRGYIGVASSLLTYDPELDGIMENLLGRIVVVDRMENALAIAKQFRQSFRIVTLEGDVLNPGGSMTGGYNKKKSSGLLGRSREITDLESAINSLHQEAKKVEEVNRTLALNLREEIRKQERLQLRGMELAQLRSREEARESALQEQAEALETRSKQKHVQADALAAKANQTQDGSSLLQEEMAALGRRAGEIEEAISVAETSLTEHSRLQSEARDALAAADIERTRLEEAKRSAAEVLAHVEREHAGRKREAQDAAMQRERAEAEIGELERELTNLAKTLQGAKQAIEEQDAAILAEEARRRDADEKINRLYVQIREESETGMALEAQAERLSLRAEKLISDLDTARSRLWEEYELTMHMLEQAEDYHPIEADFDSTAAAKSIASLRAKIRALGPVNIDAIEDYQLVGERYEFLCTQRDDITEARDQLSKVITDLLLAMRGQFQTNFDLIRRYFQETFQELFGGGEADITLEGGEDILEGTIEIKASPPGKKLQNMLLLSGGERSLTAIALLFAILKLRPTPFCVLDEIEAALDDVNTLRFTDYIHSYKEKSQFIMVTHRKGTMESADMIYGVTMQEKGVSKVLSMVLSDAT